MEMYRRISKGDYNCPNWISPEARRLLSKMLDPNPKTRVSVSAIMDNPWFRKGLDTEPLKAMAEPLESAPVTADDICKASGAGDQCTWAKLDKSKLNHLNAFDIISLSPGFDLSGLFSDNSNIIKDEVQFTSMQPASTIISKLEDVAKQLQLKITKKDGGLLRLERPEDYRNEPLSIHAEIFEFTSVFHLVELKKYGGDTLEFNKLLEEDIRPALRDIIWAWRGDQRTQERLP
uniref:non-specific serine/threonine protein kinase n=1 Tax=Kalanchoe fedtschenkoi TaxID=63787 RepID=A0A7N0ZUQ9_KALFE